MIRIQHPAKHERTLQTHKGFIQQVHMLDEGLVELNNPCMGGSRFGPHPQEVDMRTLRQFGIVTTALVCAMVLASPSIASADTTSSGEAPVPAHVSKEVREIPIPSLRSQTEAKVAAIVAAGGEVLEVAYAPFVAQPDHASTNHTAASAAPSVSAVATAAPSDCGLAMLLHRGSGIVWVSVESSCTKTVFSKLILRARLMAINPYLPTDYRILRDHSTTFGAGKSAIVDEEFDCNNSNQTSYQGYGKGTMTVRGTTYVTDAYDSLTAINCGW